MYYYYVLCIVMYYVLRNKCDLPCHEQNRYRGIIGRFFHGISIIHNSKWGPRCEAFHCHPSNCRYHLVISHSHGKSPFLIGKPL